MSERTEENSEKSVAPGAEVPAKASRRRFDAAYKLRILEEADRCSDEDTAIHGHANFANLREEDAGQDGR